MRRKRKCKICNRWFPAKTKRQKVCSHKKCQNARQEENNKNWRRKHKDYFKKYYSQSSEAWLQYEKERSRTWRLANLNYFRKYRQNNKKRYQTYMRGYMGKYRKRLKKKLAA